MRYTTTSSFDDQLQKLPARVRATFFKQLSFLLNNFRHPSLRVKKYGGMNNVFQARVDQHYRFYFVIKDDCYILIEITTHPK